MTVKIQNQNKIEVLKELIEDMPLLMTNQEANVKKYLEEELKKEKDKQKFLGEDRIIIKDPEGSEIILRSLLSSWERNREELEPEPLLIIVKGNSTQSSANVALSIENMKTISKYLIEKIEYLEGE